MNAGQGPYGKNVRSRDGGGIDWCLVRPTTVALRSSPRRFGGTVPEIEAVVGGLPFTPAEAIRRTAEWFVAFEAGEEVALHLGGVKPEDKGAM